MARTGFTIRTVGDPVPTHLKHPYLQGMSGYSTWRSLQPDAHQFVPPPWFDAAIDYAQLHDLWMIWRIECGYMAPPWLYDRQVMGSAVVPFLALTHTERGASQPIQVPVPWDGHLADAYAALLQQLRAYLRGTTPGGVVRSKRLLFIPVALPTEVGTEMPMGYEGSTANRQAWLALGTEADNAAKIASAWQNGLHMHSVYLPNVQASVAFGGIFSDRMAGANELVDNVAHLVAPKSKTGFFPFFGMTTNLRLGSDGATYRSWNTAFSDIMLKARAAGIKTGFQTAGATDWSGAPGCPPSAFPTAAHDAIDTYHARFIETYAGAIEQNADAVTNVLQPAIAANG